MTEFSDCTVDFIDRTIKNLKIIEEMPLAAQDERYEVTQLINSLLGLLVMPQQEDIFAQDQYLLRDLEEKGWKFPHPDRGYQNPRELKALLRNMRNSIAHWGIAFQAENKVITTILMKNTDPETNRVKWRASMLVSDLRIFVDCLSHEALARVKPRD